MVQNSNLTRLFFFLKVKDNIFFISDVKGMCYFPAAFQGEYVTQSIMSGVPAISYSTLSVAFDSIPVWGTCQKRIGKSKF